MEKQQQSSTRKERRRFFWNSSQPGLVDRQPQSISNFIQNLQIFGVFFNPQASLEPTHVSPFVRPLVHQSVGPSHFRISLLSASLVALREKVKKADPNNFGSGWDFLKLKLVLFPDKNGPLQRESQWIFFWLKLFGPKLFANSLGKHILTSFKNFDQSRLFLFWIFQFLSLQAL